jgi:ABC-type uncharacterized transport system auxiliary subunit
VATETMEAVVAGVAVEAAISGARVAGRREAFEGAYTAGTRQLVRWVIIAC